MRKLLIITLLVFSLLAICIVGGVKTADYYEDPSYTPTPLDRYLIDWELGEEILPYPFFDRWFDCDDATLYSYLYLRAMNRNLDIKIFYGASLYHPMRGHVWLLVSDNTTTLVYDYGIPIENIGLYKGREVSYGQLLYYAVNDL